MYAHRTIRRGSLVQAATDREPAVFSTPSRPHFQPPQFRAGAISIFRDVRWLPPAQGQARAPPLPGPPVRPPLRARQFEGGPICRNQLASVSASGRTGPVASRRLRRTPSRRLVQRGRRSPLSARRPAGPLECSLGPRAHFRRAPTHRLRGRGSRQDDSGRVPRCNFSPARLAHARAGASDGARRSARRPGSPPRWPRRRKNVRTGHPHNRDVRFSRPPHRQHGPRLPHLRPRDVEAAPTHLHDSFTSAGLAGGAQVASGQ